MTERTVRVRITANASDFNREVLGSAAATDTLAARLDAADSRMAALVQTGLALAPALVPIGAVAVPAVAGLVTQLGFATLAAGGAVFAFQGVGDALKALNDYQLDPTEAHLEKVREQFSKLGPAAGEFVLFLDELGPKMERLQRVTASGLFPGVTDGLDDLLTRLPDVRRIADIVGTTLGNVARDTGESLASDDFNEFFDYLENNAQRVLTDFFSTAGNVIAGTTELIMAFNPLEKEFSAGLLDSSRSFREWAASLDETQGFQEFVDYVRRNGPKVLDLLGSIGSTFVEFAEAAAPVGEVAVPVLTEILDVAGAIADSPLGPVLISAAAGIGVLGRSMALLKAVGLRGDGTGVLASTFSGSVKPIKDATAAIFSYTTAQQRAQQSARDTIFTQRAAADAELKRQETIRKGFVQLGKGAALVGGFALAQTDLVEKSGLSNTAMLALAGSMAGPLGAAAGAAVGFIQDVAASNDDLEASFRAVDEAAKTGGLQEQAKAIEQLQGAVDGITDVDGLEYLTFGLKNIATLGGSIRDYDEGTAELEKRRAALDAQRNALVRLHDDLAPRQLSLRVTGFDDPQLEEFATRIAPAVQAAGLDLDQVLKATGTEWAGYVARIRAANREMNSSRGRSEEVGKALEGLGDDLVTTESKVEALQTALDTLFGVQLDQSEATDAWAQSLKDLRKQIDDTNGTITGNSQAALDNRDAIRGSIQSLLEKTEADAKANVSGDKLVANLLKGRDAIVDQAVAAGANRSKVEAYLKTLEFTPENLITIFSTPGLLSAKQQVEALQSLYDLTPREVRTLISQLGMAKSQADIEKLAKQYDLTPDEVRTLIEADASGAFNAIGDVRNELDNLRGRTITTYVDVVTRKREALAEGGRPTGLVRGPGGPKDDLIPALISNREYVVKAEAVDYYGPRFFDAANALRLKDGGYAERHVSRSSSANNYFYSSGTAAFPRTLVLEIDGEQFQAHVRGIVSDSQSDEAAFAGARGRMRHG